MDVTRPRRIMTFTGSSAINWGFWWLFLDLLCSFFHFVTTVFGLDLIVGFIFSVAVDALNSFQAVSLTRLSRVTMYL